MVCQNGLHEREKFPWQEEFLQNEQGGDEEEEIETETEIDVKESSLSDSVSFGRKNGVVSAPWAHGKKPFKPQGVSEAAIRENIDKEVSGFDAKSDEIPEEEKEISNDVSYFSLDDESSDDGSSDLPGKKAGKAESGEGEKAVLNRRGNAAMAEKTLPEHELKRLRNVSLRMLERVKVGARGTKQALVDSIHEKWKLDEVVKLKFEEPLSLNMQRSHEILESKTGGLVIWRSGSSVVLYRGMTYILPCVQSYTKQKPTKSTKVPASQDSESDIMHDKQVKGSVRTMESSTPISVKKVKGLSEGETMDLNDLNQLLDELGPCFTDWLGREPLPVDADLLPAVVPDYRMIFRILPYGVKHCVRKKEITKLLRTARMMPLHFALGRNQELQGMAKAMVKLWEKSAIAKIAIRSGEHNTCNERMAEELKRLTGGTLLSRNKDFIAFYRGNDFLPPVVVKSGRDEKIKRPLTRRGRKSSTDGPSFHSVKKPRLY